MNPNHLRPGNCSHLPGGGVAKLEPMMRFRRLLIAHALFLAGCSPQEDYDIAKKASLLFDSMMDRGEYAAIYDRASNRFRAGIPRDQLVAHLTRVTRKLGKCTGEIRVSLVLYSASVSGTSITTRSSRTCANGALREQFVWDIRGRQAALLHYTADSPLLLTD